MHEETKPTEEVENIFELVTPSHPKFNLLKMESGVCDWPLDDLDRDAIRAMNKVMDERDDGAGIAAVQIGYPKRMFLAQIGQRRELFVNPVVTSGRLGKPKFEGCLSLPNVTIKVRRAETVIVQYTDENDKSREETFSGFQARVIQHEMDHLNGILITDHMQEQITSHANKMHNREKAKRKRVDKRRKLKKLNKKNRK